MLLQTSEPASPAGPPPRRWPWPWSWAAAYLLLFLVLDWASFIRALDGLNITPWNPPPALAVALLLADRRLWWVVFTGLAAAEVLVRGVPGDLFVVVAAAAALTCNCMAMAAALDRLLGRQRRLADGRSVMRFLAIIGLGSLAGGCLYVGAYAAGGYLPDGPWWLAVARYWVGDGVGLVVTLPILLVALEPGGRASLLQALRSRRAWGPAALALGLPWLLFVDGRDGFGFGYLLLLPVIWASMRFGVAGAVLSCALTQLGLVVAVHSGPHPDAFVFELQLLMTAVAITALLLGVVVDARARADAELRRSLRLAAAGQMTAALTHELSQPLSALSLHAQSIELMARAGTTLEAAQQVALRATVARMAHDARRAGEVVRRLRDFFRSGATQLASTAPASLVAQALLTQRERAEAAGVHLQAELPATLPAVWIDAVQIEVVLRNLLANALDAATSSGARRPATVRVKALPLAHELRVEVHDSGPGLDAPRAAAVFEAGASDKPGGMGIGLGICRAIVEAHGGRLWAVPADHGHFCFTLPLDGMPGPETDTDAP